MNKWVKAILLAVFSMAAAGFWLASARQAQTADTPAGTISGTITANRDYALSEASGKLKSTLAQLDVVLKDIHEEIPQNHKLRGALVSLSSILEKIDSGKGTLGALINDPSVGQSLKARQGESHWQQFFELTSAAISHVEKSPVLSNWSGLDFESTCVAIRDAELQIGVLDKLQGFSLVVDAVSAEGRRSSKYHLVILDSLKKQVSIQSYSEIEFSSANEAYEAAETRAIYGEPIEVYLVSAGTLDVLRKAYPNFFLDTDAFVRAVKRFIKTGDSVKRLGRRRKFLVKRGQGYLDF